MTSLLDRDWIAIDGTLENIDFDGFSDDRFSSELAGLVIDAYSAPGDWILDPFAGLGTSLVTAQRLGRQAIGFEANLERGRWAETRLAPPSRIIHARAETIGEHALPPFDLAFTSPPYPMVRLEDDPWGVTYFEDMQAIFAKVGQAMASGGRVIVEVSNISTEDGFRPLVGQMAQALGEVLPLEREIVRVNTSDWPAGPGVGHSSLLVFRA
jgi:hypothetical protein